MNVDVCQAQTLEKGFLNPKLKSGSQAFDNW